MVSNGIPNHDLEVNNPNKACVGDYYIELPLNATIVDTLGEPGGSDIVSIALNGVPIFGAQEAGANNAVLGQGVTDAKYWWGHAQMEGIWHYHHPYAGFETEPSETTQIGFAMDGFPLYGPTNATVDGCNGRTVDGRYQYHVRRIDQVDGTGSYCDGTSPAIKWNYIVGCFHGDTSRTKVGSTSTYTLPSDCVPDAELQARVHDAGHSARQSMLDALLV